MESDRSCHPPQLDRTDLDESHIWLRGDLHDVVCDKNLVPAGVGGDPSGGVDRPSKIVAVLKDDGSSMDTDVRRRKARRGDSFHQLERGCHRTARLLEVEHHPVAKPLDRPAAMCTCAPLNKLAEGRRQLGGRFVPPFLSQPGEASEVQKTDRWRLGDLAMEPRPFQRHLHRLHNTSATTFGALRGSLVEREQRGTVGLLSTSSRAALSWPRRWCREPCTGAHLTGLTTADTTRQSSSNLGKLPSERKGDAVDLTNLRGRLVEEFAGVFTPETVDECLQRPRQL